MVHILAICALSEEHKAYTRNYDLLLFAHFQKYWTKSIEIQGVVGFQHVNNEHLNLALYVIPLVLIVTDERAHDLF